MATITDDDRNTLKEVYAILDERCGDRSYDPEQLAQDEDLAQRFWDVCEKLGVRLC